MTGAIQSPQRSTRTVCSAMAMTPWRLAIRRTGAQLRAKRAVRKKKLTLKSGAARDQLMTPETDSLKRMRELPEWGPRFMAPHLLNSG